jgi:preprotein translocase subunit SecY
LKKRRLSSGIRRVGLRVHRLCATRITAGALYLAIVCLFQKSDFQQRCRLFRGTSLLIVVSVTMIRWQISARSSV